MSSTARAGGAPQDGDQPAPRSIGAVLDVLREEFPEVTISKIRYLETEGLVTPSRRPSGYRYFLPKDIERLRYVLRAQRDHYLPLKVIREQLEALDAGLEVITPAGEASRAMRSHGTKASTDNANTFSTPEMDGATGDDADGTAAMVQRAPLRRGHAPIVRSDDFRPSGGQRLTPKVVAEQAGVTEEFVTSLKRANLLLAGPGGHLSVDDVDLVRAAGRLADHGIDLRHLKGFRAAADREAGLVEGAVGKNTSNRSMVGRGRAAETARQVAGHMATLHSALLKARLRDMLDY